MPVSGNELTLELNYKPLPKQHAFHQSENKYRLYIGGWRGGKSWAGNQEAYKHSWLYPNNRGIICRKDFSDLRDTTMQTFFEIVPEEFIKTYNKSEHKVILRNGSEVYFKHLKDGIKLGSLELGWFFVDEAEETVKSVFMYLKGRLSKKGTGCKGWLCSNPPNKDHWLYQEFELNKVEDYGVFHASTYENRSNLPVDYISTLEKLPQSWRRKYLEGQYGFTPDGTPFYKGFDEHLHKKSLSYNKSRPLIRVWDYGFRHPALSIHQIDVKGRWLVLKEVLGTDITIQKFGTHMKTLCKEWYPDAQWIDYGDPAGEHKTDKSERTSVEILDAMGIAVVSKQSTYRERKEIIERKLATWIDGMPSLLVDESCLIIIDGFLGGYHYPVRKPGQAYNPHVFEIPYRDGYYEHLLNTVEYAAVNEFTGAETKVDKGEATYKTTGPFKDVKIEYPEEGETTRDRYMQVANPVEEE